MRGSPATPFFIILSQLTAAYYFLHFLVILPWIARTEPAPLPNSITEAVLSKHGGTAPTKSALTPSASA